MGGFGPLIAHVSALTAGCAGLAAAVATGASGGGLKPAEKSPKSSGSRGPPTEWDIRSQYGFHCVTELDCVLPAGLLLQFDSVTRESQVSRRSNLNILEL